MTTEEEKLVTDNMKLAYDLAWKFNNKLRGLIELQDLQSICFLGLCRAAQTYNSNLGTTFSTYYYKVANNEVMIELKKVNKEVSTISLFTQVAPEIELKDTIAVDYNLSEDIEKSSNLNLLQKEIQNMEEEDRQIIEMILQGKTQKEIAVILHTTQSNISRKYYIILNKLRKKFDI